MARLHRRYRNRRTRRGGADPAPRRNPPLFTDLAEWVGPGFAGFALTRFVTRVASTQIEQRKPSWGKHVGAGVSISAFLAAWFLAHRWKWLAKYHTPITVGAAIAAIQSIIQLYIPKLGWMISDASPELAAANDAAVSQLAAPQIDLQPVHIDPNEFTYDDSYDAGRYSRPTGQSPPIVDPGTQTRAIDDMSDLAIDDAIGNANLGVFSN